MTTRPGVSFAGIHCCTVTILAEGIRLPEHGSVLAQEEAVPCLSYFTVSLIDQSSWWHSGAEGEVTRATSPETSSLGRRNWGRVGYTAGWRVRLLVAPHLKPQAWADAVGDESRGLSTATRRRIRRQNGIPNCTEATSCESKAQP